ncbi:MAG TPA: histidine kinase [Chryseolinea sp.]
MDKYFAKLALSDQRYYKAGRHILFWLACWLFMGFIYGFYYAGRGDSSLSFPFSYLESLIYLPQHMTLAYGIIYVILPLFILKGKYGHAIAGVIFLVVGVAFLSPAISYAIIRPIKESLGVHEKTNLIFYGLMAGLRGSMTVAGFAVAIKLVKMWYFKNIENERLEKEKLKAELEVLKGQLNPHFMFNTLNSIYALALKKSDYTPEAILKLSQLMRYILTDCNATAIDLSKEVEVLNDYIALEKSRFGRRLDITVNVQGSIKNKMIAPLLLLPFVENSFKHGTSEVIDQPWISMDLRVSHDTLSFKLINGKAKNSIKPVPSASVGLMNVKKRLALLYPESHNLVLTEDDDTYIASLNLELGNIKAPVI